MDVCAVPFSLRLGGEHNRTAGQQQIISSVGCLFGTGTAPFRAVERAGEAVVVVVVVVVAVVVVVVGSLFYFKL